MKLGDILKTVGSGLIHTLLPGTGSLIVAGINEFLPSDKQLPETATARGRTAPGRYSRYPSDFGSASIHGALTFTVAPIFA